VEETLQTGGARSVPQRSKMDGGVHLGWRKDPGEGRVRSGSGAVDNGRRRSPSMGRRHCRQEGLGQLPSDRQRAAALTFDGEERLETGALGQAPQSSKIGGGAHLRWGDDAGVGRGSVSSPSNRKWAALTFDGEERLEKAALCQALELSKMVGRAHLRWGGDAGEGRGQSGHGAVENRWRGSPSMGRRRWRQECLVRPRSGRQRAAALTFDGEETLQTGGARSAP
jgi:hypothetical protein